MRAKYLDWCSAQVADHFLALSPDEIFALAQQASEGEMPRAGQQLETLAREDLLSYRVVVERVTEVLASRIELPSFTEWLELYERDPAGVESRLLGFWRDRLD